MDLEQAPRNATRAMPLPASPYRPKPSALVVNAAGALASSNTTNAFGVIEFVVTEAMQERWTAAVLASAAPAPALAPALAGGEQGAQVMELRRRSGLTWSRLAELFGVERRSVHFWASGRAMNDLNRERLGRILALIRRLPVDSEAVRRWLFSPNDSGVMPFDQLRDARYADVVIPALSPATTRPAVAAKVLAARAPRSPGDLIDARQDRVHREVGVARPARSVKVRA